MATITAPLSPQFQKLKATIEAIETDVTKFDKGNKAAGVRVRAAMQVLKAGAQGIRETVVQQ